MASVLSAIIAAAVASLVASAERTGSGAGSGPPPRRSTTSAERAEALKELWSVLNEHATAARIAELGPEEFYRHLQELNFFLIRRSPFLTEQEKDLARLYLEGICAFRIRVERSRNAAAREAMITTGKLGRVGELMGAARAGQLVQDLEDRFAAHIGAAMRGGTSDLDVTELRSRLTAAKFVLGPAGEEAAPRLMPRQSTRDARLITRDAARITGDRRTGTANSRTWTDDSRTWTDDSRTWRVGSRDRFA